MAFLKPRVETPKSGVSYVEDMYHGFHFPEFPGFDQMMDEAVRDARTDPQQFEDDMVSIVDVPRKVAAGYIRELVQHHFDRPGVAIPSTNFVAPEK